MDMEDKKTYRKRIRDLKKNYSLTEKKEKSERIWKQVEKNSHFMDAQVVLAYWSMDDEVYTHDFIRKWAGEKTILLPCVRGEELEIYYFEGDEKLLPGEGYGILEPTGKMFQKPGDIDLILVPGIAFDREGNRLGRGKGYYDKILKATPVWKVGVCFDFQVVDSVPLEAHDVKMDEVIFDGDSIS